MRRTTLAFLPRVGAPMWAGAATLMSTQPKSSVPPRPLFSSLSGHRGLRMLRSAIVPATFSTQHIQRARTSTSTEAAKKEEKPKEVPVSKVVKMVAKLLWPEGRWDLKACVGVSVAFVLFAKVAKVAVPFWFRTIVDTLAPAGATAASTAAVVGPFQLSVFALVSAYGLTRLMTVVMDEGKTAVFAPVGGQAATSVNMQMFKKLHQLDLDFHLSRQTGVLSKDIDRGSRAFWALAYALLFMLIPTCFEMILVGFALQSQAGFAFVGTAASAVVAYIGWTYVVTNWRAKYRDQYNAQESKVGGMTIDSLLNYETVKYFNNEGFEAKRLMDETTSMNTLLVRLDQSMALLNFGQQAIFVAAAAASLYFSTGAVLAGTMTVGDLVLVDALLLQLYTPLQWLGMLYREIQQSTQNMQAMVRLLETGENVTQKDDAVPYHYKEGRIELKNICFSYNEQRQVLNDVSLTIEGGSTVAFVGPSGSGKSTIFRLLFRFYDPSSGEILVDGQPLRNLQIDSYRRELGVVPQDTVLFNDTIRYNLQYGRLDATSEEIERAARQSHIHESIAHFPDGFDTVVGERGLKLSGGEKQRVAIARVLLKDAPIFLADEATSALDTTTESNVMRTVRDGRRDGKQRTTVIIAHRLSTVKDADKIVVLNSKGSIEEIGSHHDLLRKQGLYHSLWMKQQEAKHTEEEKKEEEETTVDSKAD